MKRQPYSIQRRLLLMALGILALCFAGLCWLSHHYAQRAADAAYDRLLAASALTIANAVQAEDGQLTVELPYSAMAMLSDQEHIYYAIHGDGGLISGYADLGAALPPAQSEKPVFTVMEFLGQPVRMVTAGRLVTGMHGRGWVTIRVAETLGTRQQLSDTLFQRSVVPLMVIMLVAVALLGFGMRRAFRPLAALEQELRQRSPDNLQAITQAVPIEIGGLVHALNDFMLRLKGAIGTLNSLVADAAHQIRTPLAALKMQAELALEETSLEAIQPRVQRIHANAGHTTQLLNQLLMDATISHRRDSALSSELRVRAVVKEVMQRLNPDDTPRIRWHVTPSARRAILHGDHVSLREMLRNVVDNALVYGGEGEVEIQVFSRREGYIVFDVSDRGPGITDAEKPLVLQRFARGSTSGGRIGSGLGLSIVQSVVRTHDGELLLRDRPGGGLTVRIVLPARLVAREHGPASVLSGSLGAVLPCLLLGLVLALPAAPTLASPDMPADTSATPSFGAAMPAPRHPPGNTGDTPAAMGNDRQGSDFTIRLTHYPARQGDGSAAQARLRVAGPTDTELFQWLVQDFQQLHPQIAVDYLEIDSMGLYLRVLAGQMPPVDVLISSAADLQLKLANDGYARAHESMYTQRVPGWARWRNEVYGFTQEPVVIAYSRSRFAPGQRPKSRNELLRLLEAEGPRLRHRIGTYDIHISGAGYLLALYDERTSANFWGMANQLGQAGVRLYGTTAELLDGLESGELDIAYNVLGPYALGRQRAGADITVVVPEDYITVLTRSALIHRDAPSPEIAGTFIDYLLSPRGQRAAMEQAGLPPLLPDDTGLEDPLLGELKQGLLQPIVLGPALLVGLDQTRRRRFLDNWTRLVTDTPDLQTPMTGR
ncbi:extracellular solute-binding protein [Pseudomonas sp. S 311-6]|nr:extracellular solute-binding protein [Pseudomonas sp. S 311-6]